MAADPARLYLDLMKRCLTDTIYIDSPSATYVPYRPKPTTSRWRRVALQALRSILRRSEIELFERYQLPWWDSYSKLSPEELLRLRRGGRDWPARAHTMIGLQRLDNLQECVETILEEAVPGDLIETGVWRGGSCIFMRAILKAYNDTTRLVWVADSFAGLPAPNEAAYPADKGDRLHTFSYLAVSRQEVETHFRRYGLLDDQVRFLEGWFKDTLPRAPIERLAVLRLDGDLYESTSQALEALYDKLSPGGFLIVDDYHLSGCQQAVHDFRRARGITEPMMDIDGFGAFWRRSR